MQKAAVLPVHKSIRVAAPPAKAFEIFTARMQHWWPRAHTLNPKVERADVVLEPRVGGRWYERAVDNSECNWGKVLVWEPPVRIVLAWQLDHTWQFDPSFVTEVEVKFVSDGDATVVKLEHRNLERYAEHADKVRGGLDSPEGWMGGLQQFAEFTAKP
jgi:uncharacterized protein YndB with AHSA1/START domain